MGELIMPLFTYSAFPGGKSQSMQYCEIFLTQKTDPAYIYKKRPTKLARKLFVIFQTEQFG